MSKRYKSKRGGLGPTKESYVQIMRRNGDRYSNTRGWIPTEIIDQINRGESIRATTFNYSNLSDEQHNWN